jgi:hypothetical protein
MRLLRALAGSLLWILAGVLGLLGVLLSVTVILLPLGIPLLMLARRLFRYSMVFFLPRKVRHPAQELGKSVRGKADDAADSAGSLKSDLKGSTKSAKKAGKKARKQGRSFLKRQRKRLA